MKNRLLAAMALCAATSSTMPLWASEWADPTLQTVDPNLATDGTGGGEYYIYHPYSGLWLTNGNDWGTTLSVGETGQLVTLEYDIDYILGVPGKTGYVAGHESVYGWRMVMYDAPSNSGFHELWVSGANRAFVDHNQQGHMLWHFKKNDNGTYSIKVLDEDPTFGYSSADATLMNGYVGVPQVSEQTYVYPCLDPDQAGYEEYDRAGLDWQFVEAAQYEVFAAKKAFQKGLIAAEEVEGFVVPEKYGELYNNADATIEEIEEATAALAEEVVTYKFSLATPENPIEVTEKINNPSFDSGNLNGWSTSGGGNNDGVNYQGSTQTTSDGGSLSKFAEDWVATSGNGPNWSIYQTVSGLPNGKYRLSAYIWADKQNDKELVAEGFWLFGKGLGDEVRATAEIDPAAESLFTPAEVEFEVIDGTATIGFKVENANFNWSGVDQFRLFYLGGGGDGAKAMLEEFIATAQTKMEDIVNENAQFSQAGEDRYNAYITYAQGVLADATATDETITETIKGLQFEMDTLDIDVKAYSDLYNFLNGENTGWGKWDNGAYAEVEMPNYEAYLTEIEAGYNERTFVPAAIDTVSATADKIFREDVLAAAMSAEEEFDLTPMIVNPNFDGDSGSGWKGTASAVSWSVNEHFNGTFDIYQDIEGLPEGTYKVTCKGFYRPAANDVMQAAWGVEGNTTNDIMGYLYGNDASVKLHHCYDFVYDEAHGGAAQITGIVDEAYNGKYAINDRHGCSIVFANGDFLNEVTCYVGADGKLRIGVKAEGTLVANNWTPFDEFTIAYVPGDVSGLVATLESNVAAAQTMLNSEAVSTTEAKEGLDAAITSASAVLEAGSTDADELTAESEALIAAIELGQKSIDLVAQLTTMVEDEVTKLEDGSYDEFMELASDEYYKLYDYVYEVYDEVEYDFETVADVQSRIDQINLMRANMMQIGLGMSDASNENPVNVTSLITNPSFTVTGATGAAENSSAGWTVTGTAGGGKVGALDAGVIESWNSDNFDIYQTLKGLPQGWYRLTCKGFYRMSDNKTTLVARRDGKEELNAYLYAKIGDQYTQSLLPSVLERITNAKTDAGDYVYDGKRDTLLVDGLAEYADYKTICVINNMVGVGVVFQEPESYNAGIYFHVDAEVADVQIGVRKDKHINNDWTIWDNFQLSYFGNNVEPPISVEGVENGKATILSSSWYTIAGIKIGTPKQRGFYIREDVMSDGTKQTVKVFVKD